MVVWQGGMTKGGWTMVLHDGEIRARPQPMTRQYWSWIFTSWDRLIWFDWENRLNSIGDPDQLLLIVDWLLEVWIFSTHCWLSEWHFSYESLCNFDLVFEEASVSNMSNDGGRGVSQEQACGCVNANAKEVATVQSSADLRPQAPAWRQGLSPQDEGWITCLRFSHCLAIIESAPRQRKVNPLVWSGGTDGAKERWHS